MSVFNQSRGGVIQIGFAIVFIIMLLQLTNLQLFSSKYKLAAESNAFYRKVVYPDRGIIFDRKRKAVLENIISYDLIVTPAETKGTDTAFLCQILNIDTATYKKRIRELIFKNTSVKPSVFEPLLSKELYAKLYENMYKFPGFVINERSIRSYPFNAAGHVLGYIGEVDTHFLKKHKDEGYEMGDYAGRSGLELTYEKVLMGQRGIKRYVRDNRGRIQGAWENGAFDSTAIAGRNLYTSMDIEVQKLAEKLLTNKIGSVVAINPRTGGIIAMASGPSYDPNKLTGADRRKNFSKMFLDTAKPLFNRAVLGEYPPGSTFKPLGALIALDLKVVTPSFGVACCGRYFACNISVNCEHKDCHHSYNLRSSLANSCNSYFSRIYQMALEKPTFKNQREGYQRWKEYVNAFGIGVKLKLDLPSEYDGNIQDTSRYDKDFGNKRWGSCFNLTLGIGQDRMLATPLQLANAMCVVANKGYSYSPHFVDSIENENEEDKERMKRYRTKHQVVNISDSSFEAVHDGMQDVTEFGTATNARIPGINMCAKTGTAQNSHGKNHSLFVAFAPRENPKIAIAVVVENAGFGSVWAAPIASLMIEQYLNDSLRTERIVETERISKADLIPSALKEWYRRKDSARLSRIQEIQEAQFEKEKRDVPKSTFTEEGEGNTKRPKGDSTPIWNKPTAIKPDNKNRRISRP